MHFGFALELSDIDLWNTDLLDTHLGLLNPEISIQISPVSILFVSIKSLRGLQDMSSRHLQDMSSRRLQDQQMFAGIRLPGLLSVMKTESERYAAQNGRQFQISEEEFCAFLGINLLMGINKLSTMKSYWSDEGLGNSLIQKAMTRARFLEILQNIHFADNHEVLPPKESEEYDHAWKLRPFFDRLGKHFRICCNQKLTNWRANV